MAKLDKRELISNGWLHTKNGSRENSKVMETGKGRKRMRVRPRRGWMESIEKRWVRLEEKLEKK